MRLAFVWHWCKRTSPPLAGALAAEDTLLKAIQRLTNEGEEAIIFALAPEQYAKGRVLNERQGIWYMLVRDRETLLDEVRQFDPDVIFLNHNPKNYDDILEAVSRLRAKRAIYYSAPISFHPITQTFDAFLVDHSYQANQLIDLGTVASKVHVAPKTADFDRFYPVQGMTKKWDCIYPARGGFGYWKRIELAVEACRLAGVTIVIPGGDIPGTLNNELNPLQQRIARRVPNLWRGLARQVKYLSEFPWVTTLEWQSPEAMNLLYNQARCLVITSDDNEMGPRVMMEAAACNLPIVCCADSRACVSRAKVLGGFVAEPKPCDIASKIRLTLSSNPNSRQLLQEAGLDTWVIYRALRRLLEEWRQ